MRPRLSLITAADVDPGLQPERTTMSWSRTAMALIIVSAIFVRWWPLFGTPVLMLPAITMLASSLILMTQHRRLTERVRAIHNEAFEVQPSAKVSLVGLALFLGITGVVLVLIGP